jgi:hypothetical protein
MITTIVWQLVIIRTDYKFIIRNTTGADPGFQVKGGGGVHLKKLRRTEGGAKIFWVFRVKNHDFTPKNHINQLIKKDMNINEHNRQCSFTLRHKLK